MSLSIPILSELNDIALSKLEGALGQNSPIFDKAFQRVLSMVLALKALGLYKYAAERVLQNLATTAKGADLERIGTEHKVYWQAARQAQLEIELPAADSTVIPINTVFIGESNGLRYRSNAEVIASGGIAVIECTCDESGVDGNLLVDDTLTLSQPITGAENTATVTDILVLGLNREDEEVYRRKVLDQIQTVGGGSNLADYRIWAQETPGINRAFPYSGTPDRNSADFVDWDMEEIGVSSWMTLYSPTLTKETTDPYEGTQVLRITSPGGSTMVAYQNMLTIGAEYTVTGAARSDGNAIPVIYNVFGTPIWTGTTSTDWQEFNVTFTAESESLQLVGTSMSSAEYVEFDGITILQTELPGNVTVYLECDSDLEPDGIPSQGLRDDARLYINIDQNTGKARPSLGLTNENLWVEPISRTPIHVEIRGLDVDAELVTQVKADIESELDAYLRNATPYIQGLDAPSSQADQITDPLLSQVIQDVLNSYGGTCAGIGIGVEVGVFLSGYSLGAGELAKLGGVAYVG